jgi:hypothetical protein
MVLGAGFTAVSRRFHGAATATSTCCSWTTSSPWSPQGGAPAAASSASSTRRWVLLPVPLLSPASARGASPVPRVIAAAASSNEPRGLYCGELAQPVRLLFLRQVQLRVQRVHVGRTRRPVCRPGHRDLAEHRRKRPAVVPFHPRARDTVRPRHILTALLTRRQQLVQFLETGPPPVSIGFGSMVSGDRAATLTIVLDALKLAGLRGVLLSGWSEIGAGSDLPNTVFSAPSIPHSWLFPRMAAVVHHGAPSGTSPRPGWHRHFTTQPPIRSYASGRRPLEARSDPKTAPAGPQRRSSTMRAPSSRAAPSESKGKRNPQASPHASLTPEEPHPTSMPSSSRGGR